MIKKIAISCLFSIALSTFAADNAALIAQTLRYLATDYINAVDEKGTVKSEAEYGEMKEFSASIVKEFELLSPTLSPAVADSLTIQFAKLQQKVNTKATPIEIYTIATQAQQLLLKEAKVIMAPKHYPSIVNGKAIYISNCSKCHGDEGLGDGKEGKDLTPAPANFQEEQRMHLLSPFDVYNAVRLGIAGTGMKAHPQLSEEQVWDVAFFVKSILYKNDNLSIDTTKINLEKIASLSDEKLAANFNKDEIAAIRHFQPVHQNKFQTLTTAKTYLQECRILVVENNYTKAYQLATAAYLEGIEPIEGNLRNSNPALLTKIEKQFSLVRKLINDKKSPAEINEAIKGAEKVVDELDEEIHTKTASSFWMNFIMSVSILMREALEAFLILLILFSIVRKSGNTRMRIYVNLGWISAILIGILMWIVGQEFIFNNVSRFELLEGIMTTIAIFALLYLGFWMHSKEAIKKWTDYVKDAVVKANETGNNLLFGSLAFIVVFREVFESVLFLSALNLQSSNQYGGAIALGFVITMLFVLVAGFFVIRFATKLPLNSLFKFSSIMMMILAIVLTGKAVRAFQEVGLVSETAIPFFKAELIGIFPYLENLIAQICMIILLFVLKKWINKPSSK